MVLLEALLVFTVSYVLAYSLCRWLGAQNARWLALAYSTAYTLVLLAPREHKPLLAMLGATAIAATALASTSFHKSHAKEKNWTRKRTG